MTPLWRAEEIIDATKGESTRNDWVVDGVTLDSRHIKKGDLFVAIKGPVCDGHDFVKSAFENGAGAALVSQEVPGASGPQIIVNDTEDALEVLAKAARRRSKGKIIAITGSFGKTSTKEALGLILGKQGKTTFTQGSFNNHWGVPLCVSRLHSQDDYGVFELGMNHAGELTPLSKIVQPDVALITTVGGGHAGNFSSIKEIAKAKAEIFAGMKPGATAILNRDNEYYDYLASIVHEHQLKIISFGQHTSADFRIERYQETPSGLEIKLSYNGTSVEYSIPAFAHHWAWNSAGALASVYEAGGDVAKAATALSEYEIPAGRGKINHYPYMSGQITVIDDSYNAGPDSMRASIDVLSKIRLNSGGRKIAVLGDMLELGDKSSDEHKALWPYLEKANIDALFACGVEIKALVDKVPQCIVQGYSEDAMQVLPLLTEYVDENDVVLVKGSRGQRAYLGKMSQFVQAIENKCADSQSHKNE